MSLKNDLNEKFFWFLIVTAIIAGLLTQSWVVGTIVFFGGFIACLATDVLR